MKYPWKNGHQEDNVITLEGDNLQSGWTTVSRQVRKRSLGGGDDSQTPGGILSIPKVIKKAPRFGKSSNQDIKDNLEITAKAFTILNYDFAGTFRSKDMLHDIFNKGIRKSILNGIKSTRSELEQQDDIYLLNDIMADIERIEFKDNRTLKRTVSKKGGGGKGNFYHPN